MLINASSKHMLSITFLMLLSAAYITAVYHSNQRFRRWPLHRIGYWLAGLICAVWSVSGPMSMHAHHSFTLHMLTHLLLGMLAPLFIALAKPMTLLLRTIDRRSARRLTRLLRSRLIQLISSPITASVLHVGGLWLLYGTPLYAMMHVYPWLSFLVHVHLFAAGFLFTISILQLEATPHLRSWPYRMTLFILASAVHAVLAKSLYAHPPISVAPGDSAGGSMLMFYGGDLVELLMLLLLFHEWYRAKGRVSGWRPRSLTPKRRLLPGNS